MDEGNLKRQLTDLISRLDFVNKNSYPSIKDIKFNNRYINEIKEVIRNSCSNYEIVNRVQELDVFYLGFLWSIRFVFPPASWNKLIEERIFTRYKYYSLSEIKKIDHIVTLLE